MTSSSRIAGAAHAQFVTKPKRKPRDTFLVEHVKILEMLCLNAPTVQDRCLAGFVTFLIYARSRFAGAMAGSLIVWDFVFDVHGKVIDGYVEVQTDHNKTGHSKEKKTMLLPLVAPACGLNKDSWAQAWKEARELAGLDILSDKILQPAPTLNGGWSVRPWSLSEATTWMNDALRMYGSSFGEGRLLGTHSCKATLLEWSAKFGIPTQHRRTLGYHLSPDEVSTFTYGRDNQAWPLRMLQEMIKAVSDGRFLPNSSRSK